MCWNRTLKYAAAMTMLGLAGISGAAFAQDASARNLLERIYGHYRSDADFGLGYRKAAQNGAYFDDELNKLIIKDMKETGGDVGRIDADPFVNAQDFQLSGLKIELSADSDTHATGIAKFKNLGQPNVVTYDLVKTAKGWRIADISWKGSQETFKDRLKAPLP